ncbi:phage portal protein [Aerococcaceae bacterium zg-B36]|uniref:phage portal protein n=1 Tax=Aerococcaceae bacterium zg-252 TaxID=2796928 RepID=UPI001BD7FD18|nr:phage portal protein [Aerococcaceae bacterium zg-B36]
MQELETFRDTFGNDKKLKLRFHRESRLRYRAESVEQLLADDGELLMQFINHHKAKQFPRIRELYDYAEGSNHKVLENQQRRRETDMADKRVVHNFGELISVFKQGYLVGNPIRVEYDDGAEDSDIDKALKEIAVRNNFYDLNRALVLDLSQVGRAYEIVYYSQYDEYKVKRLNPEETFVIYDMTLEDNSLMAVRYYNVSLFDENKERVEVYTRQHKIVYESADGKLNLVESSTHGLDMIPITEFLNDRNGMGDYESELSLIDLYDEAQSDTSNYMTDLSDAILAIIGNIQLPVDIDNAEKQIEYMKKMRKARMMHIVPPIDQEGRESGTVDAKYLYKQYDVQGTEAYKDRLANDIHKFTNMPDMTDMNFGGNQSGEAMKWKMFGLDQERVTTQALLEAGLKRRYRLLASIGSVLREINDFDISKLKITFTPNLPKSLQEKINAFKDLNGTVSNETAMRLTDIVEDVSAEMERLNEQDLNTGSLMQTIERQQRLADVDLINGDDNG